MFVTTPLLLCEVRFIKAPSLMSMGISNMFSIVAVNLCLTPFSRVTVANNMTGKGLQSWNGIWVFRGPVKLAELYLLSHNSYCVKLAL